MQRGDVLAGGLAREDAGQFDEGHMRGFSGGLICALGGMVPLGHGSHRKGAAPRSLAARQSSAPQSGVPTVFVLVEAMCASGIASHLDPGSELPTQVEAHIPP